KSIHKNNFSSNMEDRHWVVEKVEPTGVFEEVWCVQEPEKEMFTLANGIVTKNCSFSPVNDTKVFSEALFLLLSGVGFRFSVQKRHVNQLPKVQKPRESGPYIVHDSIQGWAEALNTLVE